MDILKAEIDKKRKQLEENALIDSNKKFFRRGDLEAIEREKYLKQLGHETKNEEKIESSSQGTENEPPKSERGSDIVNLPRTEVIQRLRDRGEPILLFGETEVESFKRLRKWEISEPESNRGFRNDFQEAMEKVDQDYLDELLALGGDNTKSESQETKDNDLEMTYEGIKDMAKSLGRGNRDLDMKVVMIFLKFLLKMWNEQLNNRPAQEKMGTKGKMIQATYTQTQVYLKPLLQKLKTRTLPEDILDSLTEIVRHLLNRNYLMASDAYLQMAIGNAPWPIGVTMVGIHARTGREKIFSKNVAHVMNDETQRKYIQALKRLMTKCQEFFPTDPSRCVEYAAFGN